MYAVSLKSVNTGLIAYTYILFTMCQQMIEEQLRAELNAVYNSLSWRLTAPLRWASFYFKKTKNKLKQIIVRTCLWILQKTFIVDLGKKLLNYFPSVRAKLKQKYNNIQYKTVHEQPIPQLVLKQDETEIVTISSATFLILNQLQNAVIRNKN